MIELDFISKTTNNYFQRSDLLYKHVLGFFYLENNVVIDLLKFNIRKLIIN